MFTDCVRAVCFKFHWCSFFTLTSLPVLCLVFSHPSLLTVENKSLGLCQVSNEFMNSYLMFIFLSRKQNKESLRGGDFSWCLARRICMHTCPAVAGSVVNGPVEGCVS